MSETTVKSNVNRAALYQRVDKICHQVLAWRSRADKGDWSGESLHDIIERAVLDERRLEARRAGR